MGQFMESRAGKAAMGFVGFGIPLTFLAAQVFFGMGSLPLMILTLSWLGFAVLFYAGLSDE